MARNPFRGRLTDAPRRAAKRQRAKNSRWMHLGAAEIGTRQKIQRCWAGHTLATTCGVDGGVVDACGGRCLFVPGGELNEIKKIEYLRL